MNVQTTKVLPDGKRKLTKIVKKSAKKQLLDLDGVRRMNHTKLEVSTFKRHARPFYHVSAIGNRVTLRHPYVDANGRHLKVAVIDFSVYKRTGYVNVKAFQPSKESANNVEPLPFEYSFCVATHKELYRKLLKQGIL